MVNGYSRRFPARGPFYRETNFNSNPSYEHSRRFPEFPNQNSSQIGLGAQELWSDIQTNKKMKTLCI